MAHPFLVKDIAFQAGLSSATVDRVLNNRSGVQEHTKLHVLKVMAELSGEADGDARSKPIRLDFVLPGGTNAFIADLAAHLDRQAGQRDHVEIVIHRLAGIEPEEIALKLDSLRPLTQGVGLIGLDCPLVREAVRKLIASGVAVVTLVSDISHVGRISYVGIDNRAAGRLAGYLIGRFLPGARGKVALIAGALAYRGHEEREMGFRSVLGEEFPNLTITSAVEINDEPEVSYAATMRALHNEPELLGIYCVGAGRSGVARALREARPQRKPIFICHDLTKETRGYLVDDLLDVVIDQNARLIAEQSVIRLLGSIASSAPYLTRKFIEPRLILRENVPVQ